jgi:hypothetical protein
MTAAPFSSPMDFIICFFLPGTGVASPDNLQWGTLDVNDYVLNQAGKLPSAHNDIVWAFDLGRASLGDSPAPRWGMRQRMRPAMIGRAGCGSAEFYFLGASMGGDAYRGFCDLQNLYGDMKIHLSKMKLGSEWFVLKKRSQNARKARLSSRKAAKSALTG